MRSLVLEQRIEPLRSEEILLVVTNDVCARQGAIEAMDDQAPLVSKHLQIAVSSIEADTSC
jgi:hypothetical protein